MKCCVSGEKEKSEKGEGEQYGEAEIEQIKEKAEKEKAKRPEERGPCCNLFRCLGRWTGLGCCCTEDLEGPMMSIEENRNCTDLPCCFMLLAVLTLQLSITGEATKNNVDLEWLIRPKNFRGQLCGKGDMIAKPYGGWPDVREPEIIVCLSNCTKTWNSDERFIEVIDNEKKGYNSVPNFRKMCDPDWDMAAKAQRKAIAETVSSINSQINSGTESFKAIYRDIILAKTVLLSSIGICAALCYIYGKLIQSCGKAIIWTALCMAIIVVFIIGHMMVQKAPALKASGYENTAYYAEILGYVLMVGDLLFVCTICALRKQINLAILVLKESFHALYDMCFLFFLPLIGFVASVGWFVAWIVCFIYTISVFDKKEQPFPSTPSEAAFIPACYEHQWDPQACGLHSLAETMEDAGQTSWIQETRSELYKRMAGVECFVLLWIFQYIFYLIFMIIAGAYAEWYFSAWQDDDDEEYESNRCFRTCCFKDGERLSKKRGSKNGELSRWPVLSSVIRVVRYHLGSIAVGACLIAVIQSIQVVLMYIENQCNGQDQNHLQKIIMKIVHCILETFKWIVDRCNRTAFIVSSIHGSSFCASSIYGITLMMKNPLRFSMIFVVGFLIEKVGQFSIVCVTVIISMQWMQYSELDDELSSIVMPATLVGIISYFIVSLYMMVFQVGIDTIFFCFLVDEKCNEGEQIRASRELLELVDMTQIAPKKVEPKEEESWGSLLCGCAKDEDDLEKEKGALNERDLIAV